MLAMKSKKPNRSPFPSNPPRRRRATPLAPAPARAAERAWLDHVTGLYREGPARWAELTEAFVREREPGDASRPLAVLLLATDLAYDMDELRAGRWVALAAPQVRAHYEGEGYDRDETLALVERFVVWLGARGELSPSDVASLRAQIDEAREDAETIDEEHCFDLDIPEPEVATLCACFAAEQDTDAEAELAAIAVSWLAAWLRHDVGDVDFEALDPEMLAVHAYEEDYEQGRHALATWSVFYRWLGRVGVMEAGRAERIATRLAIAALPMLPTGTS